MNDSGKNTAPRSPYGERISNGKFRLCSLILKISFSILPVSEHPTIRRASPHPLTVESRPRNSSATARDIVPFGGDYYPLPLKSNFQWTVIWKHIFVRVRGNRSPSSSREITVSLSLSLLSEILCRCRIAFRCGSR